MTIQPEIATLEQLIKQTTQQLEQAKRDLDNYKQLVKLGTVTLGTPLDDFVFVHHTDDREYWHNFYSALANLCTEDTPIMIEFDGTTSRLVRTVHNGPHTYGSSYYNTKKIGILTSTIEYDIQKGNVLFPVEFYISNYEELFAHNHVERSNGPLTIAAGSFKKYGKHVDYYRVEGDISAIPHDFTMKIIFGSKDEYLKRKAQQHSQNSENIDYSSLFEQKRLVGPYDQDKKVLRLTNQ